MSSTFIASYFSCQPEILNNLLRNVNQTVNRETHTQRKRERERKKKSCPDIMKEHHCIGRIPTQHLN